MKSYILVVEDEAHLRELLALEVEALTRQVVRTASSGAAAINTMEIWGTPSLIIADHVMLDGDGIELGRHCADRFPESAFVLCSAAAEQELKGALQNAHAVLRKPVLSDALAVILKPFSCSGLKKTG